MTPESPAAVAASSSHPVAVDTSELTSSLDRRKTIIGGIVTLVVLIIIFVGLIPKFGSYADAWAVRPGDDPGRAWCCWP